jgi:predicted metal-dependent hydrolase
VDIERESIIAPQRTERGKNSHFVAPPKPRSPRVDLDSPIPRHWFGGNVFVTHTVNGICILFPAGERFFVRSVNHYLPEMKDASLRERVKGFFGQEGRHAKEHERAFRLLEEQGYDLQKFLKLYERVGFRVIEKIAPRKLSLATTVALEHYTAILAEHALATDLLDKADPRMRALLSWHAAEEIEHRSVAFDVLKEIDPSYALRMAGMAVGTACLLGFWVIATGSLLMQEENLPKKKLRHDVLFAQARMRKHLPFWRGLREYLQPSFHPDDHDTTRLAHEYLKTSGLDENGLGLDAITAT